MAEFLADTRNYLIATCTQSIRAESERSERHWSVDVRYIPEHRLGEGYIYVINILENYSRAILASVVTRTQDLKAYLMVLYAAVKMHGCPEVLVSDSGAIFLARAAQEIYSALGIEKKQIARRQPWQNLIETHFSVQHRMADYHFAAATTWQELVAAHEQWTVDYNYQEHWAHQERINHRHCLAQVLEWVRGKSITTQELTVIFRKHAHRDSRTVDKYGYVKFKHWRIYGERGLIHQKAGVWLWGEKLNIEFSNQTLAEYSVKYDPTTVAKIHEITVQQLYEDIYPSPQLILWNRSELEFRLALPVSKCSTKNNRAKLTNINVQGRQLFFNLKRNLILPF